MPPRGQTAHCDIRPLPGRPLAYYPVLNGPTLAAAPPTGRRPRVSLSSFPRRRESIPVPEGDPEPK